MTCPQIGLYRHHPRPNSSKKHIKTKDKGKGTRDDEGGNVKEVSTTQQETEEDDSIITKATFSSLGVCEPLCKAIETLKWEYASRIQKESLPASLKGRDIIGLAETGSGKTGAFAIPILQALLENPQRNAVFAVILAPTRELAFQIHEVVSALGLGIGASAVCIVGGVDQTQQSIALAKNPHVVTVLHILNTAIVISFVFIPGLLIRIVLGVHFT